MTSPTPLQSLELIDCARANSKNGIAIASQLCGYDNNVVLFEQELKKACESIGVTIHDFHDLMDTPPQKNNTIGISPETSI